MTEFTRPNHDDARSAPGGGLDDFDCWEELFAALDARSTFGAPDWPASDTACSRRIYAWSLIDPDVAAAGTDLPVELALAANSRCPNILLTAVARLVDACPDDEAGRSVYTAAFRQPRVRLALSLARHSGADPSTWYETLEDDLLAATHELLFVGVVVSGTAVVERARVRALRRLGRTTPVRALVSGVLSRTVEAVASFVRDVWSAGVIDRLAERIVPLEDLAALAAMVDGGVAFPAACRALRLWRFVARRRIATYQVLERLHAAEVARIARDVASAESGGHR